MVSVGLAVDDSGERPGTHEKQIRVVVAAQAAVHHRPARVVSHTGRTGDVSRALEVVGVMDFRGVQPREDLVVDSPRRRKPPT